MEAAEPGTGGIGERGGGDCAALHSWIWTAVSRASAPVVHRAKSAAGLCAGGIAGRRAVGITDHFRLRGGGRVPAFEDSLDVVARNRRIGDWPWGFDFSTSTGRWLRHDSRTTAGQRHNQSDSGSAAGEMVYLGCVARFRNFGRRAGAFADVGRGTGRIGSDVFA